MHFDEGTIFVEFPFDEASPTLVDIGANDGTWAARFAEKGWRVVAFEPEPATFARLQSEMTPHPNVTCVQKAASDSYGTLPLYTSAKHPGIHTLVPFHATHEVRGEVDVVRLDDELASLGVNRVTALKVDAEGADLPVLKGFPFGSIRPELVMAEFMDSRTSGMELHPPRPRSSHARLWLHELRVRVGADYGLRKCRPARASQVVSHRPLRRSGHTGVGQPPLRAPRSRAGL